MIVTGAPTTHAAAARRPRASGAPVTRGAITAGPTARGAGLLPPYAEGIPVPVEVPVGGSRTPAAPADRGVRAPGTSGACP